MLRYTLFYHVFYIKTRKLCCFLVHLGNHDTYDDYRIISDRSEWKEILSLYSIKISNDNELVITVDEEKVKVLKEYILGCA